MIIARVLHPERGESFGKLEPGRRSFGSDFDCDVVLIDDSVAPRHFEIDISDAGVTLHVTEGESVSFHTNNDGELTVKSDTPLDWTFCDRLQIGDLEIQLRGDECSAPPPRLTALAAFGKRAARYSRIFVCGFVSLIGLIVILGLGSIAIYGSDLISANARLPEGEGETASDVVPVEMSPTTPRQLTRDEIETSLTSLGLTAHALHETQGVWRGTFYFQSVAARNEATVAIDRAALPLQPKMKLDSSLLAATNIVLRGMETNIEVERVEDGVLYLSAGYGAEEIDDVRTRLRSDVPALRDITIATAAEPDMTDLISRVGGIWAGDRPSVFLTDGTEIRPGEAIDDQTTLVSVIGENRLLVDLNGIQKEILVP